MQQALGYEQTGPDEMAVIKRPPLIVPPDYNLRPPRPNDQDAAGRAASDAARETLVGPSSSVDDDASADPLGARAILTGGAAENGTETSDAASEPSDGQNLLVSRTDRAERDLGELTETRSENRVDGALLRRLLSWTREDRSVPSGDDQAGETAGVVQVVGRSQTLIEADVVSDRQSAE